MKIRFITVTTVALLLTIAIANAQTLPAPKPAATSPSSTQIETQTSDEDLWVAELAFERAITTKHNDAARLMFHADFLGVDADGSTYTADGYFVRRSAESLFFDVED